MEIVEPRKIYENWRPVMVHNITGQVFELPILQTVILYINS